MSGKRRQNRGSHKNKLRTRLIYAVSILALTALVGVAFFSPGWVFGFQDSIRCSDTVLEERENVNVTALSTNYESSFYQRMINFAESLDGNTNFYVTSEELTGYDKLDDFLYSNIGLQSERIWMLIEAGLITEEIFHCQISAWKQYIIYSDDYTKGVNFILWYIELEHSDENVGTYKLLVEADTGELYGLRADTGGEAYIYHGRFTLEQYLDSVAGEILTYEGWVMFAYFYSGLPESSFARYYEYYELVYRAVEKAYGNVSAAGIDSLVESLDDDAWSNLKSKLGIRDEDEEVWLEILRMQPTVLVWDDGNTLEYTFPYNEERMTFRMQMEGSIPYSWRLLNITVGFPAIYELIPEFQTEKETQ